MRFPKTLKETYDIDRQLGTYYWIKEISKEMANGSIYLEKLDGVTTDGMRRGKISPGYEHVNVHMIFETNMDGMFTRKEILVADEHTTAPKSSITYSSVMSREIIRIVFLLESLNDLDIFACEIGNAHLNTKFRKNFYRSEHIFWD